MDDKKKDLMLKKYGRQVDKRMMALQNMELPEKDFYDKLWRYLSTTPFLPTFEARVIGLYNCVIDKRLPYYAINRSASLSMDQEEFEAHLTSIGEKKLGRMEYILNADFDQKTEQSSLIVAMMDSLRTFEERTVFLARVIAHFKAELHTRGIACILQAVRDDLAVLPGVFSGRIWIESRITHLLRCV